MEDVGSNEQVSPADLPIYTTYQVRDIDRKGSDTSRPLCCWMTQSQTIDAPGQHAKTGNHPATDCGF